MQLLFNSWQSSGEPLSACSYCAAKRATAQRPAVEVKGEIVSLQRKPLSLRFYLQGEISIEV
jgi:hypothetical protein